MDTATFTARREFYVKTIRSRVRTLGTAMDTARAMMSSKDEADAAAEAMNALADEFGALPKEKREASGLSEAIRAFYKDMSTACSHERANLKRELNDPAAETARLHARFPFRIRRVKSVYVVVPAAEYDAATANRRKGADDAADNAGEDGADAGASSKNADKAAQAIAALEFALAEMTADRDAWKTRALLAESTIADLTAKPAAKKPAKPVKVAKAA